MKPRQQALIGLALIAVTITIGCTGARAAVTLPDPNVDEQLATKKGERTIILAGGCFWGVEAVFEHLKGVKSAISGYSGGTANTAEYELVSSGRTGHAEAVKVTYDPSQITLGMLLKIFFAVAHDPTQLNRQGPDIGPQYRSAIFFAGEEQKRIAQAYMAQLDQARVFPTRIVTEMVPLTKFYQAEDYHQDYLRFHPDQPYIIYHDLPKLEQLRKQFPELYKK
jgi:peptide-methionine (S)-S-oxide reductase